jgi:photosystem I P700 chlorophyll a apoprotein A1
VVIGENIRFLTFKGGLNPVTGGLLTDIAHHHLALSLFIFAGHMYRTNWGIGHSMKEILEAHKGPFTGEGHSGLYEILTTSWHAQLAITLAMLGSLSIVVAHHMYAMPPIHRHKATDYATQLHYSHTICGLVILCSWWCCSCQALRFVIIHRLTITIIY